MLALAAEARGRNGAPAMYPDADPERGARRSSMIRELSMRPDSLRLTMLFSIVLAACEAPPTAQPDADARDAGDPSTPDGRTLDGAVPRDAAGDGSIEPPDGASADAAPIADDVSTPMPDAGSGPRPPYDLPSSAVPVRSCGGGSALEQRDTVIDLPGGRPTLITTWMPGDVYARNAARAAELVRWADRSMCSTTPLSASCNGLFSTGERSPAQPSFADLVVVTPRLLLWFDLSSAHRLDTPSRALPNGGGGMLRGAWALATDASGLLNFADIRNGENWAPNALLPGALPTARGVMQGGGLSAFITDIAEDTGETHNLENDPDVTLTHHAPSALVEGGTGTLHDEGLLVQAVAHFVSTRPVGDRLLLGRAGTSGRVRGLTTYRIAACDDQVLVESIWTNESAGRVGPVVNMVLATNVFGEENHGTYAGNLLEFSDTRAATCVVRTRHADTSGCHTERVDYRELAGNEHAYQSRAALADPPPTMSMLGRLPSGDASGWALAVQPLQGITSLATIFDLHSQCWDDGCDMVAGHDISVFNSFFWETEDTRLAVPDRGALPPGIEREGTEYFLAPGANVVSRMALRFSR